MRTISSFALPLLSALTACDSVEVVGLPGDASTDGVAPRHDARADAPYPACAEAHTSNLTGAHVEIDPQACRFTLAQAAAGIVLPYRVVIDHDIEGVVPAPLDYGRCNGPDASGLSPMGKISGGNELDCRCDVGPCPYTPPPPATLRAGEYIEMYHWEGRNWRGPSDTSNPMGSPFPAGSYTFAVRAAGEVVTEGGRTSFEMSAELGFELVP